MWWIRATTYRLLEDPYEVIETLAPLAVSTHIKDMALDRHADGFLLAETPLRAGDSGLATDRRRAAEGCAVDAGDDDAQSASGPVPRTEVLGDDA